MSLIQCPGCHTSFKVKLDVLGKQMKCPKCRKHFRAESRRGGSGGSGGSSAGYVWAGLGIAAFIGILVYTTSDDEANSSAKTDKKTYKTLPPVTASHDVPPGWDQPGATEAIDSTASTGLRGRVDELLETIQFADERKLRNMTNLPAFHDRLAEVEGLEKWNRLQALDHNLATKHILDTILKDEADRDFLKTAFLAPEDYTVVADSSSLAKVFLVHRKRDENGGELRQDRTIEFKRSGPTAGWMTSWIETTRIYDEATKQAEDLATAQADRAEAAAQTRVTKRANLGKITRVAPLPATTPARQAELDGLAALLTDLSLTREASKARRTLESAGKEAIPSLLNVMVDRENLSNGDQAMIVNQAVMGLRKITGQDYGFAPSANPGSVAGAESIEHNRQAIARWFGWWKRNKDTWSGLEE